MNVERLRSLADRLRRGDRPVVGGRPVGFDMTVFFDDGDPHGCGTAGCVAGWAIALFDPRVLAERDVPASVSQHARDLLGLTDAQASELFVPVDRSLNSVTAAAAAAAIDALVATGGERSWYPEDAQP